MARRARAGSTPTQRQRRVGEELRHALSRILQSSQIRDPDLADQLITVTEVRVSPDLSHATAFIMPLGGEGEDRVVAALARATPYLRGCVAQEVQLRIVPELVFRLDDSFANAARIDALLDRHAPAPPDDDSGEDGHGA